eukprot:gene13885-4836_t
MSSVPHAPVEMNIKLTMNITQQPRGDAMILCLQLYESCKIPLCNACSFAEENDETPGWWSGTGVSYCGECSNEAGIENNIPDKKATKISSRIDARTLENESDDDSLANGDDDEMLNIFKSKEGERRRKPVRKAKWNE